VISWSLIARATGLILALAACSAQASSPLIPGTRITLEEAFFLPGEDRRYVADTPNRWLLCRDSDTPADAHLALLGVVLSDGDLLRLQLADRCNVRVSRAPVTATAASDMVVDAPGCRVVFGKDDEELASILINPSAFSAEQYEKCLFRVALFLKGFNGALAISDEDLFVSYRSSPWSTYPRPPRYVPLLQIYIARCDLDTSLILSRNDISSRVSCRPI
jgi:hypothetical protein